MINVAEFTKLRDLVERIDCKDWRLKQEMKDEINSLAAKFYFYKDTSLHGRDSSDALGCRACRNSEEDFMKLDLEYPDL